MHGDDAMSYIRWFSELGVDEARRHDVGAPQHLLVAEFIRHGAGLARPPSIYQPMKRALRA